MKINKAIEFYKHDYAFLKLAKSTQESYAYYLKIIDKLFGQRDILKLAERELIYEFRDYINKIVTKNPRKAKYLLDVFKILVNWCFVNQLIRRNPINMLTMRFNNSPKINNIWSEADVEFVMKNASKPLQSFIILALETGLRRCDLIKLKFTDIKVIDGHKVLVVDQQKTGSKVTIPLSHSLCDHLNNNPHQNEYILNSVDGTPWHEDKFNHAWQRLKKRLNLTNITPHGLRKTAVTRLVKAGCTVPEISAILGWSISSVQNMLDKHYFQDKLSVATSAIQKLNNSRSSVDSLNLS